jgi:hypothetical protein
MKQKDERERERGRERERREERWEGRGRKEENHPERIVSKIDIPKCQEIETKKKRGSYWFPPHGRNHYGPSSLFHRAQTSLAAEVTNSHPCPDRKTWCTPSFHLRHSHC